MMHSRTQNDEEKTPGLNLLSMNSLSETCESAPQITPKSPLEGVKQSCSPGVKKHIAKLQHMKKCKQLQAGVGGKQGLNSLGDNKNSP